MKNCLFAFRERRIQLTNKISSLKSTRIINRLFGSIYTLTLILTLTSCAVDLDDDDGIKTMAAGINHTVALKADGTLWAWGGNSDGQLGDGANTDCNTPVRVVGKDGIGYLEGVTAVTAGWYYTVALKADGTVWAWGSNADGQLGDGTKIPRKTPVQVNDLVGVKAVAAGINHTVALKADGTLRAWGDNTYGQLGIGTTDTYRNTPVQVVNLDNVVAVAAGNHTVAIKNGGTLWAWGSNYSGQLGNNSVSTTINTPVQVKGAIGSGDEFLKDIITVFAGLSHTLAIKNDGTLLAWGQNGNGQLGLGDGGASKESFPKPVGTDKNWALISGGSLYTIAGKSDGTIWAWGLNNYGQLGLGHTEDKSSPQRLGQAADLVKVSAGNLHSAALRRSGILWTWGDNQDGQLGDGTNYNRSKPGLVKWD